jgi:hypothetical protein
MIRSITHRQLQLKMKFDLISDLHEDINKWSLGDPNPGSEILVIAGDLCEYRKLAETNFKTLREANERYKHVIYVPGNHEYYGVNFQYFNLKLKEFCEQFSGIHFLQPGTFEVPDTDVAFIGGTLFTDMNGDDKATKYSIVQCLADFSYIFYTGDHYERRIITPQDYVNIHREFTLYFENECERLKDKKIVLVTHHAMSDKSVMPRFQMEYLMNGGFRSKMDWFFEKHKNVHVHCHGHMHDVIRYTIANTRVYCNPYGYQSAHWKSEENKPNYGPLQIEV